MPREYGKLSSRYWTGKTGKELRGHKEAQILGAYFATCASSNMLGLYYLPIPTMSYETGLTFEEASKGLHRLEEVGYCKYDYENEVLFVPEMARFQIAEELNPDDYRITGMQRTIKEISKMPFFKEFYAKYETRYRLNEAPPKHHKEKRKPRKPKNEQVQSNADDADNSKLDTRFKPAPAQGEIAPSKVTGARATGAGAGAVSGAGDPSPERIDSQVEKSMLPIERLAGANGRTDSLPLGAMQLVKITPPQYAILCNEIGSQSLDSLVARVERWASAYPEKFAVYEDHFAMLNAWNTRGEPNGHTRTSDTPTRRQDQSPASATPPGGTDYSRTVFGHPAYVPKLRDADGKVIEPDDLP